MKSLVKKTAFKLPTARQILDHTASTNIKSTLSEMCQATLNSEDGNSFRINGDILPIHRKTYLKYWETLTIKQRTNEDGTPMLPNELRRLAFDEWLDYALDKTISGLSKPEDFVPVGSFAYERQKGFDPLLFRLALDSPRNGCPAFPVPAR